MEGIRTGNEVEFTACRFSWVAIFDIISDVAFDIISLNRLTIFFLIITRLTIFDSEYDTNVIFIFYGLVLSVYEFMSNQVDT